MCVHHYEGSWTALNPAGPYYGGFQADASFMAAYGRFAYRHYGDARHWAPHRQLHMAWRGWKVRGWSPWPQTAARCGLL